MRLVAVIVTSAALAALASCVTLPDRIAFELRPPAEEEQHAFGGEVAAVAAPAPAPPARQRRELDARTLPLANGQIIVSEAGGAMSLFYSLFAADFAPWVHAGIVAIEDGQAVVYEANGDFVPVPGLSPTTTIRGTVRRVGVQEFVRGKRIVGLYGLPPQADRERLVAFAREQHRRATPFDPYFDTDDAGALYCTELVARVLDEAGVSTFEATPVREENASLALARDWLKLRSRSVWLAGRLVEPRYELGRWSPDLTPSQIEAYFAVKRELHRRFDASARLGHVFRWTGARLRLRANVQRFVDAALAAAPDHALEAGAVSARVGRLARELFHADSPATAPEGLPADGSKDVIGASLRAGDAQVTAR